MKFSLVKSAISLVFGQCSGLPTLGIKLFIRDSNFFLCRLFIFKYNLVFSIAFVIEMVILGREVVTKYILGFW